MSRWKHLAILSSLLVFGTGCSCCCCSVPVGTAPDLTQRDLVGTWANDDGTRVVFNADGTFTATDLDRCEPADWDGDLRNGGTGTWTLHDPEFLDPDQELDLAFDDGYAWPGWHADRDDVLFTMGDPDIGRVCQLSRTAD